MRGKTLRGRYAVQRSFIIRDGTGKPRGSPRYSGFTMCASALGVATKLSAPSPGSSPAERRLSHYNLTVCNAPSLACNSETSTGFANENYFLHFLSSHGRVDTRSRTGCG